LDAVATIEQPRVEKRRGDEGRRRHEHPWRRGETAANQQQRRNAGDREPELTESQTPSLER
jgi:hypothetical protein